MYCSAENAPVYLTAEIRELEAKAALNLPPPGLMERAGLAAAEIARTLTGGGRVLVVAGPGNNGGDAFVVARHLKSWWFKTDLVFAGDAAKLPADARAAHDAWHDCGGDILNDIPAGGGWDLVVDGLFGIGLQRDISGRHAELVAAINRLGAKVLALDLPSGLASDSGRVLGCAVRADHTATFIALKPGLLTSDGPDCCGHIHVCTLGLDPQKIQPAQGAVIGSDILRTVLPARHGNSHKGDYGSVGIIGGAPGMVGAALLAARAALHLGAGRVYAGLLAADAPGVDPMQPELMLRTIDDLWKIPHLDSLAVGPGLGMTLDARLCVRTALESRLPLILDADALNLIAAERMLQDKINARNTACVMTPHPAEAARLLDCTTTEVQADRVAAACAIAKRFRSHVVLKGAGSVCASPDGNWFINTSGNPGMASAGMGDVLTCMIAALIAQGADAQTALLAAVHLHGAAGDALVAAGAGPVGMTAGEVGLAARSLFNKTRQPV
jgi:hydroxyethylthiazole kinase-like uncharacterized protein yjeF